MKRMEPIYKNGKFGLEEKDYDVVEDHRNLGGGSGSEWSVIHEETNISGHSSKDKHIYSSYNYALMDIGQRFREDFNKYKKHLSTSEQKHIMDSFAESLEDEKGRHPHYLIKGTYFNKEGKTCFFEAKAEIEGQMVRAKPSELQKEASDKKEKSSSLKKYPYLSASSLKRRNDNSPDFER